MAMKGLNEYKVCPWCELMFRPKGGEVFCDDECEGEFEARQNPNKNEED